jgi:hypothetical protein
VPDHAVLPTGSRVLARLAVAWDHPATSFDARQREKYLFFKGGRRRVICAARTRTCATHH